MLRGRVLACGVGVALALNVLHVPRAVSLLPWGSSGASASSDVLLRPLGMAAPSQRVDDLLRTLPAGPGVIVIHDEPDPWLQAYHAIMARTPRASVLVACPAAATPFVRLGRSDDLSPVWRIDLRPGSPSPLDGRPYTSPTADARVVCDDAGP